MDLLAVIHRYTENTRELGRGAIEEFCHVSEAICCQAFRLYERPEAVGMPSLQTNANQRSAGKSRRGTLSQFTGSLPVLICLGQIRPA